jgi:hypothetical protein
MTDSGEYKTSDKPFVTFKSISKKTNTIYDQKNPPSEINDALYIKKVYNNIIKYYVGATSDYINCYDNDFDNFKKNIANIRKLIELAIKVIRSIIDIQENYNIDKNMHLLLGNKRYKISSDIEKLKSYIKKIDKKL